MPVKHWKLNIDRNEYGNIWFTADHHFGHENIIEYCDRPFDDVESMNQTLVQKWNQQVQSDDLIFHLGDFTLQGGGEVIRYLSALNGNIKIIPGGHDKKWMRGLADERKVYIEDGRKIDILDPLVTADISDVCVVLCHYAMKVWDRKHYGSYHLYGHSHGNLEGEGKSMDVGVDTNDFELYSLEDIADLLPD